jgi:hypothetical protein
MAQGVLAGVAAGMKIETSAGHMISGEIDGFRVVKSYNDNDKSGALIVALGKQAALTFSYRNLPEDDAVALARKLDWKALAAAGQ